MLQGADLLCNDDSVKRGYVTHDASLSHGDRQRRYVQGYCFVWWMFGGKRDHSHVNKAEVLACRLCSQPDGHILWQTVSSSCVSLFIWTSCLCVTQDMHTFIFLGGASPPPTHTVPIIAFASGKSTIGSQECYIHSWLPTLPWVILNLTLPPRLC